MEGREAVKLDLGATIGFLNPTSVGEWILPTLQATDSEAQTLAIPFPPSGPPNLSHRTALLHESP